MFAQLRSVVLMFVVLTVITGVAYPLLVTVVAQIVFPYQANGSLIVRDGKLIGSELIGQSFDDPKYFWSRPSATSAFPDDASASSGSNLGPTNPALFDAVRARVNAIKKVQPESTGPVPIDLVTASASGLDPQISPAAAEYQAARVAKVRGLSDEQVHKLVAQNTEDRTFGILGEPRVNVLKLNLALDDLKATQ
jgi:potassium-transporting ATPase KdpC subunit